MPKITVITPTTGKPGLHKLIESLRTQMVPYLHLLLWDDIRDTGAIDPRLYEDDVTASICLRGKLVQGKAAGSALRAVGLMAANTEYVTFADDDTWLDPNHLLSLEKAVDGRNWAFSLRRIYSPSGDCLGVDRFESVGEASKLPYRLVDNNTNLCKRRFGVAAAQYYRETKDYNDDRLMYEFLKKSAGEPGKTGMASVNQTCPARLEQFFRENCSPL